MLTAIAVATRTIMAISFSQGAALPDGFSRYRVILTPAEAHEQFAFNAAANENVCAYYDYTAVLPTPFPVTARTRYWLLIRAGRSEEGYWGWRFGRFDNGISAGGSPNPGIRGQARDLAFSLSPL